MEIEARQDTPVFRDGPAAPARGPEATEECIQREPSQGFEPRRLRPVPQVQVDIPRPPRSQRRDPNTTRKQKICERLRSEGDGAFASVRLLGFGYPVQGPKGRGNAPENVGILSAYRDHLHRPLGQRSVVGHGSISNPVVTATGRPDEP